MKKKFLILASLFFTTMFAQAREVNVVVKGITPTQIIGKGYMMAYEKVY